MSCLILQNVFLSACCERPANLQVPPEGALEHRWAVWHYCEAIFNLCHPCSLKGRSWQVNLSFTLMLLSLKNAGHFEAVFTSDFGSGSTHKTSQHLDAAASVSRTKGQEEWRRDSPGPEGCSLGNGLLTRENVYSDRLCWATDKRRVCITDDRGPVYLLHFLFVLHVFISCKAF